MAVLADTIPTVTTVLGLIRDAGVIGVLALALWGFFMKWWVPGWLYQQEREENATLRELAHSVTDIAERFAEPVVQAARVSATRTRGRK
jgi:hypothetical protein